MNVRSLHVKSVIYDAATRMFRAHVSFLDTRGTVNFRRITVEGRPDWGFNQIAQALIRGVQAPNRTA